MRCSNCDSDQFTEDDATGQLICMECGVGTGVYHGITQSQEFTETRGLRVVGKVEEPTKLAKVVNNDTIDLSTLINMEPDLTSTPTQVHGGIESLVAPCARSKKTRTQQLAQDDVTRSFLISDGSDEDPDHSVFQTDQTGAPKQYYRPWRLSEPFTLILRRQAEELASLLQLSTTRRKRFLDTVWQLWLNYLSITGELGEPAWAHASAEPIRATRTLMDLCDANWIQQRGNSALLAYLTGPTPHGARMDRETDSTEHRLRQFMWAGWSTLYEPNEGRENKDPFLKPLLKTHHAVVTKYRRMSAGRGKIGKRCSSTREIGKTNAMKSTATDTTNSVQDTKSSQTKPKRRLSAEMQQNMDDGPAEMSSCELPSFEAMTAKELIEFLQEAEDSISMVSTQSEAHQTRQVRKRGRPKRLLNRRDVYRKHIIQKLLLPDPWKRVFWRGQIQHRVRCLLSHNLAVLFFAYMSISPVHQSVVNPISWPHKDESLLSIGQVALTSLITLNDLFELCRERRLTFIDARESLPSGQFAIHDQYLISLFQPKRPPPLGQLGKATNQMLHFLGCFQLPRLPFDWLVHRHVITLGLPEAIYNVCRLLLKRLRVILSHSADLPTGPLLVCSIPWTRVLRVEVTAMAMVVIALRLLFKFDDLSEYRLACVAKALKSETTNSVELHPNEFELSFDWTAWATYVDRLFHRSSLSSVETRVDLTAQEPEVLLRCNNVRGSDLALVESAKEFLGPYEFKLGESLGWGESVMYARKHGQTESKTALTKPLRDLLTEREEEHSHEPTLSSASSPQVLKDDQIPEMCLTQVQKRGLHSPFRQANIDFLLNPETSNSIDLFNSPFAASLSIPERQTLSDWWIGHSERRCRYVPICASGSWTNGPTNSSRLKGSQSTDEPVLPVIVERLIRAHDRQLAEYLQLSALMDQSGTSQGMENVTTSPQSPVTSQKSGMSAVDVDRSNGSQTNVTTNLPAAAAPVQPSESIQWLVKICAIACGATSTSQLLLEIEMLEQMLFPKQQQPGRFRQVDLALIACLDLR